MGITSITTAAAYMPPQQRLSSDVYPFPLTYSCQPIRIGFDYKITATNSIQSASFRDEYASRELTETRKRERTVNSVANWKLTTNRQGSFSAALGSTKDNFLSYDLSTKSDSTLNVEVGVTTKIDDYDLKQSTAITRTELRKKVDQIQQRSIELVENSGYIRTVLEIHNPTDQTIKLKAIDLVFLQTDPSTSDSTPLLNIVLGGASQLVGTVPGAIRIDAIEDEPMEVPPTLPGIPFVRTVSLEKLPNQVILDWMRRQGPILARLNSTKLLNTEGRTFLAEELTVPFRRRHVQIAVFTADNSRNYYFAIEESVSLGQLVAAISDQDELPLEVRYTERGDHLIHSFYGLTSSEAFSRMSVQRLYDQPEQWTAASGTWILEASVELPNDSPFEHQVSAPEMFRLSWVSGENVVKTLPPEFNSGGLIATLPASAGANRPLNGLPFRWYGAELPGPPQATVGLGGQTFTPVAAPVGLGATVRVRCQGYRSFTGVVESVTDLPEFHGPMGTLTTRYLQDKVELIDGHEYLNIGLRFHRDGGASRILFMHDLIRDGRATVSRLGGSEFEFEFQVDSMMQPEPTLAQMSVFLEPPTFVASAGRKYNLLPRPDLAGVPRAPQNDPFSWTENEVFQEAQFVNFWIKVVYAPRFQGADDEHPGSLDDSTYWLAEATSDAGDLYKSSIETLPGGWPRSTSAFANTFKWKDRCLMR